MKLTEEEYYLGMDEGSYATWANLNHGVSYTDACIAYRNSNWKGKYVLCEQRNDTPSSRLFIRDVTQIFSDSIKRKGWWNTFTFASEAVDKGLWLCTVEHYRKDRNGHINLVAMPLCRVPELAIRTFLGEDNGTWESSAMYAMIEGCRKFLPEYEFSIWTYPNVDAIRKAFPEYADLGYEAFCEEIFLDWAYGKTPIEKIEQAANTPTPREMMLDAITTALWKMKLEETEYGKLYPALTRKLIKKQKQEFLYPDALDVYLEELQQTYFRLTKELKMPEINSCDQLAIGNAVCAYYDEVHEQQKTKKTASRKGK